MDESKDARAGNKPTKKVQFKQEEKKGERAIKGRFNRQIAAEKEERKQSKTDTAKLGKRPREDKEQKSKLGKRPRQDKDQKTGPTKRPRF